MHSKVIALAPEEWTSSALHSQGFELRKVKLSFPKHALLECFELLHLSKVDAPEHNSKHV